MTVPKESASSHKALPAQPVGLDPATQHILSALFLDATTGGSQIISCLSSPTWDLRRSSPHCWGQPSEEMLTSLLHLQTIILLAYIYIYIYVSYAPGKAAPFNCLYDCPQGMELAHSTPSFIPWIISLNCRHHSSTCGHVKDCSQKKLFSGGWTFKAQTVTLYNYGLTELKC